MGFGSGSGDDPWEDDETEETTTGEPQEQTAAMDAPTSQATDNTPGEQSQPEGRTQGATKTQPADSGGAAGATPEPEGLPVEFSEVEITDHYSTIELAQMLMAESYHEENPQVPYATWRNGTSTGRTRTTIELNPNVDDLVKVAMREFENRYDGELNKADLREFALVYGLMHVNEVFEMAEEWGLQYNG